MTHSEAQAKAFLTISMADIHIHRKCRVAKTVSIIKLCFKIKFQKRTDCSAHLKEERCGGGIKEGTDVLLSSTVGRTWVGDRGKMPPSFF